MRWPFNLPVPRFYCKSGCIGMNEARLSYVALVVRDPGAIATAFGDRLGMPAISVEVDGGRPVPAFAAQMPIYVMGTVSAYWFVERVLSMVSAAP